MRELDGGGALDGLWVDVEEENPFGAGVSRRVYLVACFQFKEGPGRSMSHAKKKFAKTTSNFAF